jgi:flagellin-like protein
MNLKTFTEDDRAVSPVIGIILMVAITVILAAVIGTFVLGLGDSVTGETAPQASWDTADGPNGGEVVVAHNGGDSVEASNLDVTVDGSVSYGEQFSGTVSAGSETKVTGVSDGQEVQVIWNAPDSDSSQELTSYEYTA